MQEGLHNVPPTYLQPPALTSAISMPPALPFLGSMVLTAKRPGQSSAEVLSTETLEEV